MARITLYIMLSCLGLVASTMAYLLTLVFGLPAYVAIIVLAILFMVAIRYRICFIPAEEFVQASLDYKGLLVLLAGLLVLVYKAYGVEEKYGHWDAWWLPGA